jgi:hypothetical protein
MSRTPYPEGVIYGVLRTDLVDAPVVVGITPDRRAAELTHRQAHRWWRRGYFNQPQLKPKLVSAQITWIEIDRNSSGPVLVDSKAHPPDQGEPHC